MNEENEIIESNFTCQPEKYEKICNKAKELAYLIENNCLNSKEKSLAFTKLKEVVMWANASIARND